MRKQAAGEKAEGRKIKRERKKDRGEESEGNTTYQSPAGIIQLSHRNIVWVWMCVCVSLTCGWQVLKKKKKR